MNNLLILSSLVSSLDIDDLFSVIIMEGFVSIFMSIFVLKPLSQMISFENKNKIFWGLFLARIVILLICDFFIAELIMVIDFLALFILAFIINTISTIKRTKSKLSLNSTKSASTNIAMKCEYCGKVLSKELEKCPFCGAPTNSSMAKTINNKKEIVKPSDFDLIYSKNEDLMLDEFLNKHLQKANIDITKTNLIPSEILRRKKILSLIFSFLLFVFISMIFFHFPLYAYIIGFIILVLSFFIVGKYNLKKYLIKEIKSRPQEKVSNIIMNTKVNLVNNNLFLFRILSIIIAIVLPLILFINPRIIYEDTDNGYAVRYYVYGLLNSSKVEIPSTHNGKNVVSLRGNAFSNMPNLKEVILPDTITEIRGQAFLNDSNLVNVTLPKNLKYLGGSAFAGCTSLKTVTLPNTLEEINGETFLNNTSLTNIIIPNSVIRIGGNAFAGCTSLLEVSIPNSVIEIGGGAFKNTNIRSIIIPNSVTTLGGESFQNATKLEEVILSENLTEIRGNTFENCSSLREITIPKSVTRIGGHAFYGDYNLSKVNISEDSKLIEIGSSAFRRCNSLYEIALPSSTVVNERAFKESPTSIHYFD